MTRAEFERQMAAFRDRITELPADEREAIEDMVQETIARHEEIRIASLEGHRAAERLELAFELLGDACRRLAGLTGDARQVMEQLRARRRPEPGLN